MIYPSDMEYLKTTTKKVCLPKGNDDPEATGTKNGRGNLVFLFSWDFQESLRLMTSTINFSSNNRYKYYYFNSLYKGAIKGKRYNIRAIQERKSNYKVIDHETRYMHYPYLQVSNKDVKNTYFDLYKYMQIYFTLSERFTPLQKMRTFWEYFIPILTRQDTSAFYYRCVLIDASNYTNFSGPLKDTMKNPLFIIYYTLYKGFDLVKNLDIDFLIYCGRYSVKVNPSKCDSKSYRKFLLELKKIFVHKQTTNIDNDLSETEIDKKERAEETANILNTTYNFIGDDSKDEEEVTDVAKDVKPRSTVKPEPEKKPKASDEEVQVQAKVDKKIEVAIKNVEDRSATLPVEDKTKSIDNEIKDQLNQDKELLEEIYRTQMKKKVTKSQASSARDKMLRDQQVNIKVKDMNIGDIQKIDASHMQIPSRTVSRGIHTTNSNVKQVRFTNFEKEYNEKVMKKDIVSAVTMLNDKSLPVYLRDVKVEDTSDELNYKETWTFLLEDSNRQRHTIKVDIPKFLDDKFMYLGGNKKLIDKQNFLFPVVKTGPDTVQIVTNYNKMFIRRVDTRSIGSISRLNKFMETNNGIKEFFTFGNAYAVNESYVTTIEYDEFSKIVTEYNRGDTHLYFSQMEALKVAEEKGLKIPNNQMFIGFKTEKPIYIDYDSQKTSDGKMISDLIFDGMSEEERTIYGKIKTPKRLMYAKVKTMEQDIPVISLLAFWEGLDKVLQKAKIEYHLEKDYPSQLTASSGVIRFQDCYMVYEDKMTTALLMNGLRSLPTEQYPIADFNTKEPYIQYFKKVYGKIAIANTLVNSYEFTLDPITIEVLKDLDLPTDLVTLMIYAVNLLADSQYSLEIDEKNYRIRSNEIVAAILYDSIAKNYITYKNSNGRKKLSIPRDAVIKQLLKLKTVEDYSTLNPILELERTRTVTCKGWRGANLDRSYTIEKRTYHPNMVGIMGVSTSPDASCGVTRSLSMEPGIKTVRGYVDIKDREELGDLKDVNVFSPAEMLVPLGVSRDDETRIGHAVKQSKHVIPVTKSSPVLISNGAEETCRFNLSSDFVVNADQDGKVIEYNTDLKIMVVEYKDGTHRAINLAPTIVKNGGGGFFLSNELITELKLGDTFKKDDVLAYHKDFFTKDKFTGTRMNMGTLSKVAIMSNYDTYQDATFITHKLAKDAGSEMVFLKQVVIGKNSNVSFIANVGDHVEIGDSLVQFDTSYDDSSLNQFLANLSKDPRLQEEVLENTKNNVKSKYAGVIEDIKIYSTVDLKELSPSLQTIVGKYYSKIKEKNKMLSKYDPDGTIVKCGMLLNESSKKVEPNQFGVIKGQKVEDSVLVEFYVKHTEMLEVGSKIA